MDDIKRLNILVITPWFPNTPEGYQGNFIYHSVKTLSESGIKVYLLVIRPWTPKIFWFLNRDWVRPPLDPASFTGFGMLKQINYFSFPNYIFFGLRGQFLRLRTDKLIRKWVQVYGINIIHAHTEDVGYVVRLGEELGIPVILTLHGINTSSKILNTEYKRRILRETLNNARRVILVGEPLRSHFYALAGKDDNFRIVPNGFYSSEKIEGIKEKRWAKRLNIISISNLYEEKGVHFTIEALAMLSKEGFSDWEYKIIGDGRGRNRLEGMSRKFGLQNRIHFYGALPHNAALSYLNESNIFILPSYKEAFGVAYLEAMANGLLTVGVKGQGPEAFIHDGITGYLVPPKNTEAIYLLLRLIITNDILVEKIARAGQEYVWREFTWDQHAKKMMRIYSEVINERA